MAADYKDMDPIQKTLLWILVIGIGVLFALVLFWIGTMVGAWS